MFEFISQSQIKSDRAKFANHVCKMIYQKNKGDLSLCIIDVPVVREFFEEHVRNIYEHVDSKIPLFALYELNSNGAANYGMTSDEYEESVKRASIACVEYYDFE